MRPSPVSSPAAVGRSHDRSVDSIGIKDDLDWSWTGVLERYVRGLQDRSIDRSVELSGATGRARLMPPTKSELFVLLIVGILTLSSGR